MAYKTVKFGTVLDRVFRSRGFDPDQISMTAKERARYGEAITRWTRKAWDEAMWPQLMAYEQRTYRPPYQAEVSYNIGHQVWDETTEMYWESLEDNNVGNTPPASKIADTHWKPAEEMKRYIQFEQPWESVAIDEDGVDVNAFAYRETPIGNPSARPVVGCRRIEDCVMLPDAAVTPDKPWVRFKPQAPRFALELWAVGTAYAAGELVYLEATRECYIATAATTGDDPSASGSPWAPVGFPDMFQDYVVLAVTAELQSDDEGKYTTRALAEEELERLVHKKTARAGEGGRVFVGRRR
jgi:hypothetical protein